MLTAYTYKNQHLHCKITFKNRLKSPKLYKKIPNISEKVYYASENHDIHNTNSPKF